MRRAILGFLAILTVSFLFCISAEAREIYVRLSPITYNPDGSTEYPYNTIIDAVNAAKAYDKICVAGDAYSGNLIVKEGVELYGGYYCDSSNNWTRNIYAHKTVIKGDGTGNVVLLANDTILDGFTITGSSQEGISYACVMVSGDNIVISHNVVYGNMEGIIVQSNNNHIFIFNNLLYRNISSAIYVLKAGQDINIANNTITYNESGISLNECATVTIINNIVVNNNYGIKVINSIAEIFPTYNDVFNNNENYNVNGCNQDLDGVTNISLDPLFVDPDKSNYHLLKDSPCIDTGNPDCNYDNEPEPNGDRIDLGCYGNTSESTASSISSNTPPTIKATPPDDNSIYFTRDGNGKYCYVLNKDRFESKTLYFKIIAEDPDEGSFGSLAIVNSGKLPNGLWWGQIQDSTPDYAEAEVIWNIGGDVKTGSYLLNFDVTEGETVWSNVLEIEIQITNEHIGKTYYVSSEQGNDNNSGTFESPWATINCAVSHMLPGDTLIIMQGVYNESINVVAPGLSDLPILVKAYEDDEVTIMPSSWQAIDLDGVHNLTIEGIRFVCPEEFNFDKSGILLNNCCNVRITRCKFSGFDKGITLLDGENFIIDNCILDGNIEGIDIEQANKAVLLNNVIYGNMSYGLYIMTSKDIDLTVINCIFAENGKETEIIKGYENAGTEIYVYNYDYINLTEHHNIYFNSKDPYGKYIFGGLGVDKLHLGEGDMIKDPKFVNPAEADFRLKSSSPAVDNGYDLTDYFRNVLNITTGLINDFESTIRPQLNSYDIGAYEMVTFMSQYPTVKIEGETNVKAGQVVTLYAVGSDPDGDYPLTYVWKNPGNTIVDLNIENDKVSFTAPDSETELTLIVEVIDSQGASVTALVGITVNKEKRENDTEQGQIYESAGGDEEENGFYNTNTEYRYQEITIPTPYQVVHQIERTIEKNNSSGPSAGFLFLEKSDNKDNSEPVKEAVKTCVTEEIIGRPSCRTYPGEWYGKSVRKYDLTPVLNTEPAPFASDSNKEDIINLVHNLKSSEEPLKQLASTEKTHDSSKSLSFVDNFRLALKKAETLKINKCEEKPKNNPVPKEKSKEKKNALAFVISLCSLFLGVLKRTIIE